MIRHIATLHMEETEAKADFLRHSAQVKATIPAEKVQDALSPPSVPQSRNLVPYRMC